MKNSSFLVVLLMSACGFAQTLQPKVVANPSVPGSIQPNLAAGPRGSALLSWVEPSKDGSYRLRYAEYRGSAWSAARTIASGRHFWRHPAEAPGLITLSDGTLLAHWIENGKDSSEAEFILVSTSRDGIHWTEPQMAHHDRSPVQHGLASVVASGPHEASILWLQALKGEDGPVSLMRTIVGADGKEIREEHLDDDVCSCCPTSVVNTGKGLLVAYRDHTPKDIRDIGILRFENGRWSASKILHADKWEISACPVNAAAAAAKGNRVAVAWYTEADDMPRVQLAFSSDAGATFTNPVKVSTADALGYASTTLSADGGAIVSWLEGADGPVRVQVRRVSAAGAPGPVTKIAEGSRQRLGYPRLLNAGNSTWIAWGDAKAG
ncbi:MAG TPA: hypothetical protein VFW83_07170, partial [Bryobacteraceae bacterium]|nr:hypothetical protein [Bryobacteraceae bacterium]